VEVLMAVYKDFLVPLPDYVKVTKILCIFSQGFPERD
jgi:hypothetical protein